MIAPTTFGARDFAPTPLKLNLAGVAAVVLDVLGVAPEVVSAAGGGSHRGSFGSVRGHERGGKGDNTLGWRARERRPFTGCGG